MSTELTLIALVLGSLAVTALCRRYGLPAPLVLVVAGLLASLAPGVVEVTFDPNVVMLLVLTPLLYSAGLGSSYAGIRANLRPIGLLAVGLVAFTTVVVGFVAWWVVPGLTLPAGLVLGAIVAPPDAVSALTVGRRLGLPRRMMTILNGESLGNDATALTLFRVFVAVAAGTGATVLGGVGMFVLAAVGGVAVGFVVGWVVHRIRRKLDDPQVESALGLVVPFGVYLLAESLHSSGVLAVVVAGIYLGYRSPESGYATRLQDQAVWQASDTILESVVFALIGLQATAVVDAAGAGVDLIGYGLIVHGSGGPGAAGVGVPGDLPPARAVPRQAQERPVPALAGARGDLLDGDAGRGHARRRVRHPADGPRARHAGLPRVLRHRVATLPPARADPAHGDPPARGAADGSITDVLAEAQAQQAAAQAGIARLDELTADESEDSPAGHAAMKTAPHDADAGQQRVGAAAAGRRPRPGRRRARSTGACAARCCARHGRSSSRSATPVRSTMTCCAG